MSLEHHVKYGGVDVFRSEVTSKQPGVIELKLGHFGLQLTLTHLCHIYASLSRVIIGLDNELSPLWCQAII